MIIDPMKQTKGRQKSIRRRKKARRCAQGDVGSKSLFCIVYAICDEAGNIRYIGQTRQKLAVRIKFHRKEGSRAGKWMQAEVAAGRNVTVHVITDRGTWNVSEVIWIERARATGCLLLNRTRGGDESSLDGQREVIKENHFRMTGKIPLS
jgi:hypothetical protein